VRSSTSLHHAGRSSVGACPISRFLTARWASARAASGYPEPTRSMLNCPDAKFPQDLVRQTRKNRLVYVILAECRLILPEAQAPQPDHNVHGDAHNRGWRASSAGEARVSRVALGFCDPNALADCRRPRYVLAALAPAPYVIHRKQRGRSGVIVAADGIATDTT
jgi:hypothetical protein